MNSQDSRPLDAGRVFTGAFGAVGRNLGVIAIAAVLFSIAPDAVGGLIRLNSPEFDPYNWGQSMRGVYGETILLGFIAQLLIMATIKTVALDLDGETVSFGKVWNGLGRVYPGFFAVNLLIQLGILVGLLLLILPGLLLATIWIVAAPAKLIEGRSVRESFDRSSKLTSDHRWRSLLLMFSFAAIAFGGPSVAGYAIGYAPLWFEQLVSLPVTYATSLILWAALTTSLFHQLRLAKEGPSKRFADVFD